MIQIETLLLWMLEMRQNIVMDIFQLRLIFLVNCLMIQVISLLLVEIKAEFD